MNPDLEINRLVELMPASGRMYCKIKYAKQSAVITTKLPRPGQEMRPVLINFDLWQQLPQPQRDLLLLHTVTWLTSIQWFKLDLDQGLAAAGIAITLLELLQLNPAGMITFGGLTALATARIWRKNCSSQIEMAADEKAVQIAQRRGYSQTDAACALIAAIETVAQIEERNLTFAEVLRCQNLQKAATPVVTLFSANF